jgi:hypothetical protein
VMSRFLCRAPRSIVQLNPTRIADIPSIGNAISMLVPRCLAVEQHSMR